MFSIHQCKWIEGMNLSKETNEHSDGFSQKSVNREVVFATDAPSDHSKRKRYLTAKYDRRTRQKISEKIKIENFVFDQLRALYSTEIDDYDCDIDVDEISDLETNEEKIRVLKVICYYLHNVFLPRKSLSLVQLDQRRLKNLYKVFYED
ncbi:hypothetical protein EWB00_009150 [Schistosoma japonicum]|uniref:PKC-activated phosphatase-1 inhibitor n=1 Tax=Schistosoma japonicum TaxID=6182 RepID=C1L4A3_SCHJA|nr:hypothetical protein EWB00_009150 [Schistosoma japonicum]CAX69531.1 PKC-activated phosphatase-1 inhibitor [Schistosoma japonicum]